MWRAIPLLPLTVLCAVAWCGEGDSGLQERTRLLLGFGADVALNFPGDPASVDRASREVTLKSADKEYSVAIGMAGNTRPVFRRGKAITIRVERLDGDAVGLAVCFVDSQGMEFGSGNFPLKAGANVLTWEIPAKLSHHWGKPSDGTIKGDVRITRVLLIRWPHASTARIRLDGIEVKEAISQSDCVNVELKPNDPLPAVAPGSDEAHFVLTNTSEEEARVSWNLTATLADGTLVREELPLVLAPKAVQKVPVAARLVQRHGLVRLDWRLSDAGGERTGSSRLAVMKLAGHDKRFRDRFMFGCGGGAYQALRQIGIDVLRCSDNFTWGSKAGVPYDWSKELAEAKLVHELGFEISWLTTYTPPWGAIEGSRQGGWVGTRPIRLDVWRAYMKEMVGKLKEYARFYEIWNEADLDGFYAGDFNHYRQLLQIAHEEIKKADPTLQVMTSGWAVCIGHGGRNLNPDIQRKTIAECQDLFDYHAFHQHGDFYRVFQGAVDGELADIRKALKSPKPLFYTETSVCSGDDWSSQVWQGEELMKKVVFAWARGAYAYEWFVPVDHDERWGLLDLAKQAKPAYCTYNTLIRTLRGLAPAGQIEGLGRDRWGFTFADPKGEDPRHVLVIWRENEVLPDADFRLTVGKDASCMSVDMWGNESPEPVVGGEIRLQPRFRPVFLVVKGGKPVLTAASLAVPEPAGGIAPGETFRLAVQVGNPPDSGRKVRLSIGLPDELKATPVDAQSAALDPATVQTLAAAVDVPADARMPNQGLLTARLGYAIDGAWSGELLLPLEAVRVIPPGGMEGRAPDFILDRVADVVNFYAADPANADKVWKGPADLSAKVWLARQDGAVHLRVEVSDDVFDQPYRGGDCWKGDGLQVTLEVPGQKGWWELGLYRTPDGKGRCHVFQMPVDTGLANPWDRLPVNVTARPGGLVYDADLRDADLGLNDAVCAKGIRFNMIVNDCDVKGARESYVRIAKGIGESKTMTHSPLVRFRGR